MDKIHGLIDWKAIAGSKATDLKNCLFYLIIRKYDQQ